MMNFFAFGKIILQNLYAFGVGQFLQKTCLFSRFELFLVEYSLCVVHFFVKNCVFLRFFSSSYPLPIIPRTDAHLLFKGLAKMLIIRKACPIAELCDGHVTVLQPALDLI